MLYMIVLQHYKCSDVFVVVVVYSHIVPVTSDDVLLLFYSHVVLVTMIAVVIWSVLIVSHVISHGGILLLKASKPPVV